MTIISTTEAAAKYARKGYRPIPVPHREKNPGIKGWESLRIGESDVRRYFNGKAQNVGILLGEPSQGLTDVDLDCDEARQLAPHVLPKTPCIFGRPGNPQSHWIYVADPLVETAKYLETDKSRKMLVELRSTGAQTIFPPSTHDSGERIAFIDGAGEPANVEGPYLHALVSKLAAMTLLARHWGTGSRHYTALALSGGLARAGWAKEDIEQTIEQIADAAGDDEIQDRVRCATTTFDQLAADQKVTGWKTLAKLLDRQTVDRVREWLGIRGGYEQEQEPNQVDETLAAGADRHDLIFAPNDPLPIARAFRCAHYSHRDGPTLHFDGDLYHVWDGTRHVEHKPAPIRAKLYPYLERAKKYVKRGDTEQLVPFAPNQTSVNNAMDALASLSFISDRAPCWLSDRLNLPDPREIVAATNGLVRLRPDATAELIGPPTPRFFSPNALDYAFDPRAPAPGEWLRFLDSLWPDDREAIECLQDWAGYLLTPDARQQKALMLVGPKRSGKGTIARTLSRMVGLPNVCGPTLSGLASNFGLWPLIGKLVAIVSDARLSGRTDQAIIVERILALTGEDAITVDRKNLEPVTLRLLARLMILTNELPRLADASGALASRFIILTLTESFYGREDTALEEKIGRELPGILLWSIDGWKRLRQRGHFVQPATSADAIEELNDLASPISAFIRDWCVVRAGTEISIADLFEAWGLWCKQQGRDQPGTQQVFGRDLRAAQPRIGTGQRRTDSGIKRVYEGIGLTATAQQTVELERCAQRSATRDYPLHV